MEPFIGEVMLFGGNFAPRGWAFCNGQLLAISQNQALFSILGTTYGGDGRTTFGLPELRGRAVLSAGQGPGLSNQQLGERIGVETVTLNTNQLPAHQHSAVAQASTDAAEDDSPTGNVLGSGIEVYAAASNLVNMAPITSGNQGGGQAHENMSPYGTANYIIALVGTYPSRS